MKRKVSESTELRGARATRNAKLTSQAGEIIATAIGNALELQLKRFSMASGGIGDFFDSK